MSKTFFLYLVAQLLFISITKCDDLLHTCIDTYGSYTNPSPYKANLDTLLSTLNSENKTTYGFYNASVGNTIYGVALCTGDTTIQECQQCLDNITQSLPPLCATQNEAVGWYDDCMLHYSSRDIRGLDEVDPVLYVNGNTTQVSNGLTEQFNNALGILLSRLQNEAASGDLNRKFATGDANYANFNKIYAMAQCTPDTSFESCYNCLGTYIAMFPNCCNNSKGASANGPTCRISYSSQLFYRLSASSSKVEGTDKDAAYYFLRVGLPIFVTMLIVIAIIACLKRKKSKNIALLVRPASTSSPVHPQPQPQQSFDTSRPTTEIKEVPKMTNRSDPLQFDLETLKLATDNFDDAKTLGRGGFGAVYKGLLPNGQQIAVKRLASGSTQGDTEFGNEVRHLADVQHPNLVTLLGFCTEDGEKLLVYEFVLNLSLEKFLHGSNESRPKLKWKTRFEIIMGIGEGVSYLHRDNYHFKNGIIHRDLKPQNILLDGDMKPKIADFGMARLVQLNQTSVFASKIVGTYGYIAPEYAIEGCVSPKIDVYSFGVMLLEIISGKSNSPFQSDQLPKKINLLNQAWLYWKADSPMELVDPSLGDDYSKAEFLRCIQVGLLCVQENPANRPKMSNVVDMLRKGTDLSFLKVIDPPTASLHQPHRREYEPLWSKSGEDLI